MLLVMLDDACDDEDDCNADSDDGGVAECMAVQ